MQFRFRWVLFLCIVIFAGALRFYQLGAVPTSLNADEVAIGYNAYSILNTGKDEYGKAFPLLFQSFDDFKLPVYVYLVVPSVAIFGLTDVAVRFPSALFGTLTVLLTYFLVKELFSDRHKTMSPFRPRSQLRLASEASREQITKNEELTKNQELRTRNLPLLSALLLAISPWHLQFSRSAYEANIAVFFTVLGITCLLKGLRSKWFYIIGFLSLALSVWSYHSSRIFIPLMIGSFTVLYVRDIWKSKLYFAAGALLCFLVCIPLLLLSFSSSGLVRAKGVSALDDPTLVKRNVIWRQTDIDAHIPFSNIFHNHRLVNIPIIIKGYLDHYSPNFFFSETVQAKYHAPGMGLMYLWELPFLLIGIVILLSTTLPSTKLLFSWFLFAPVAASVTHMLPHPVRTLAFLPTLQIFTAFGILSFLNWTISSKPASTAKPASLGERGEQKTDNKKIGTRIQELGTIVLMSFVILVSAAYYLHQYYVHGPVEYALDWQYGHEQVVEKVRVLEPHFDTVVVSTTLDQPYIFFLYYLRYDPQTYVSSGGTKSGKFDEERNAFGKFEFHTYMQADAVPDPRTLYVGTPGEMLPGTWPLADIKDPSGNIIYVLFGTMTKVQWNQAGNLPYLE